MTPWLPRFLRKPSSLEKLAAEADARLASEAARTLSKHRRAKQPQRIFAKCDEMSAKLGRAPVYRRAR